MKNIVFILIGVVIVAVLAVSIFVYSGVYNVAATSKNSAAKEWLLATTLERSVASRAGEIKVPNLDDRSRLGEGAEHYDAMCVSCHGAPGRERAEFAAYLNPEPPDFGEAPHEIDRETAQQFFWVIKNGIEMTGMPAWGPTHSDETIWDMVAFMRQFSKMSARDYQESVTMAEKSGHHHGAQADGHDHGDKKEAAGKHHGDEDDGHDHGDEVVPANDHHADEGDGHDHDHDH